LARCACQAGKGAQVGSHAGYLGIPFQTWLRLPHLDGAH